MPRTATKPVAQKGAPTAVAPPKPKPKPRVAKAVAPPAKPVVELDLRELAAEILADRIVPSPEQAKALAEFVVKHKKSGKAKKAKAAKSKDGKKAKKKAAKKSKAEALEPKVQLPKLRSA